MQNRLETLDALRGIASLAVVLFHYFGLTSTTFFSFGCTGVDLFFIISGFIIFYSIQINVTPPKFLLKRFVRLYPVYWVSLFITIILFSIEGLLIYDNFFRINLKTFLGNLTMVQSYFNISNIDGPYWTLSVEMTFYFVVFLTMFWKHSFLMKYGYLLLVFPILMYIFNDSPVVKDFAIRFKFLVYIPLFYSGILFYIMFKQGIKFQFIILVCISFIIQLLLFQYFYKNIESISFKTYIISLSVIYGLFFLFILNKLNWIINIISLFYGKISYSLYLIHNYTGILIINLLSTYFNIYISILITILIITGISYLLYYFIENKLSNKLKILLIKK